MSGSTRRVLVTRPLAQAGAWVDALVAQGVDAVALPLVAIEPARDPGAIEAAWHTLPSRRFVVFVSANAAQAFFAGAPQGAVWPAGVRAAATGPGTVKALRALGVPPDDIDAPAADAARFDSEALWAQIGARAWSGARVLVVRGDGGRGWLAERLAEGGATVDHVEAYHRARPVLDAAQAARLQSALEDPARHVWLFSSSEAIGNLDALSRPVAGAPPPWPASCAVTTHPRIAQAARDIGFGRVHEARATLADVVACIQSMRP